jgi:arsenite-transporting ATPase
MSIPFFLQRILRLLIFGGKGGGGKTTCAVATALYLARHFPHETFLLVSTDPAHSLKDSLAGFSSPGNLQIMEFDARESLETFKRNHREHLRRIASCGTFLDEEDISRLLELSLPGLDELMPFLEIAGWEESGQYTGILVDTAPTGHTLRLLAVSDLVQRWLAAVNTMVAKHRYMRQRFAGTAEGDELDEFLQGLSDSIRQMEALLRDPLRCRFIPVMIPEVMSVEETAGLLDKLEELGIPVTDIVVNKLYLENDCLQCLQYVEERDRQIQTLRDLPERISRNLLWGVPLYEEEVRGLQALEAFWQGVSPLDIRTAGSSQAGPGILARPSHPENPATLPSGETRLLLFAGKGGVGKTTLACASALRLAQDWPEKKILLFSTDPAHSLADCLDVRVGSRPSQVAPRLTALAINAPAEFEALKGRYQQELEELLGVISPHLDLTFDREVMERIMDLAPSGLDEVMALTRVMELLAENRYDLFILDTAPTGHLIRLLELPELMDQWLKTMFDLFLKYRKVMRVPKVIAQMVQISKNLKQFRRLLKDSHQSALYAVTILTEMAFEETKDLIAACNRLGVPVPAIFLNLAVPECECPLCRALRKKEDQLKAKWGETFSSQHQVVVHRQGDLRGLKTLAELGHFLFRRR